MVNLFSVGAANGILLSQSILLKPEQSLLIFSHRMDMASQKCACICQNYKQLAAVDKGHICCECENRILGQEMLFSSISIRDVLLMLQHNTCVCVCVCAHVSIPAGICTHVNYIFICKISHVYPVVLELIQGLLKLSHIKGWERSA